MESGEIKLSAVILPPYAGAVNYLGQEPITNSAYKRGIIQWDFMPNGEQIGRARIDVPAGTWNWVIYCYHPSLPLFYAVQKLHTPLVLSSVGVVDLDCITMEDIKPNKNPLGVLPD